MSDYEREQLKQVVERVVVVRSKSYAFDASLSNLMSTLEKNCKINDDTPKKADIQNMKNYTVDTISILGSYVIPNLVYRINYEE